MVSPSKLQHQEQKQPSKEYILNKCSYVRIQKGLKPLAKKSFYLDIKNHAASAKLEAKIKDLGGVIELFLVRTVSLVVTDRIDRVGQVHCEKYKWGCISGGSGGTPSLRSIEFPTPTPPTPLLSSECPLYNTTNLQGHTTQRSKSRTDAMLERALTQPQHCSVDPLDNALNWGIPIWATDKIQAWLDKIYASLKDTSSLKHLQGTTSRHRFEKDLKVKHLKGSYVKFESFRRDTRPVFLELSTWPTLNFDGDPGTCPFDAKRREKLENKTNKEIKENREAIANKKEGKEMTRRPRAARARRTEQLGAGYCEICRIDYRDLAKHVQSDQHSSFVQNDDNFLSLDTLINTSASVEAFLKLNRTKDIGEECNIYPTEDRTLRDVLPEEKIAKNEKTSNNYSVQGIDMVQCNGTRRNLNLKLNSPHNLRTRAKHESGHLLRSKGSPWHEVDKNEKFYDKFEGFTIKKRAKGTIWIEEEDPENKYSQASDIKSSDQVDYNNIKSPGKDVNGINQRDYGDNNTVNKRHNGTDNQDIKELNGGRVPTNEQNGVFNPELPSKNENDANINIHGEIVRSNLLKNNVNINGLSDKNNRIESWKSTDGKVKFDGVKNELELQRVRSDNGRVVGVGDHNEKKESIEVVCNNDHTDNNQKELKALQCAEKELGCEKLRSPRVAAGGRRGGRSFRGRHRLSVEERLIEDNRAYYKVEVLGSKLRSSTLPCNNTLSNSTIKDAEVEEEEEEGEGEEEEEGEKKEQQQQQPSSEKPVVVRFKRVRKSELSLLSDEAESFMFGEPKRDDTSEISDEEQTSVLPRDTESDYNETISSDILSSSLDSNPRIKQEILEEDSQDSVNLGRARKRRRTQAEALIKDNADYYKFETPGSRLRYQAPLSGVNKAPINTERKEVRSDVNEGEVVEKIYPSKPSAEVERMQFSFEVVPKSEPWYQTYQRQDEGAEFWHYFSDGDTGRPFLLPYEIENFHETILRNQAKNENRKKGRGRSIGCIGRSPRKSPRCHASTLAIMSTIIRKREQQQITSNLCTIEECQSLKSQMDTQAKADAKGDIKLDSKVSDIDEELKEIARNIDEMLNTRDVIEMEDAFEPDNVQMDGLEEEEDDFIESTNVPKGPPANLLELLDNCHELVPCIENSSCASSECGEGNVESPLKRRKKRKNRTGWPGIKIRKKLQNKMIIGTYNGAQGNFKRAGELSREKSVGPFDEKNNEVDGDADMSLRLMADTHTEIVLSNGSTISSTTRHNEKTTVDKKNNKSTPDDCDDPGVSTKTPPRACPKTCPKTCLSATVIGKNKNADNSGGKNSMTVDELRIPKVFGEAQRTLSDKNFTLDIEEEVSENDPGNDENHENVFRKDVNGVIVLERQFIAKTVVKKRPRINTSSEGCESRTEIENHDILSARKDMDSGIVSRKHHSPGDVSRLGCQQTRSENSNIDVDAHRTVYRRSKVGGVVRSRKRVNTRKQQRRNNNVPSESVYESENCKNESYLSITCKKQETMKSAKKQSDETIGPSVDLQDSAELECALSERNTPTTTTTMPPSDLQQRRSSIEFQPVVRMMKIDNPVDMDHSILSVTVASNRRLRSSNSHRTNAQPPRKRLKTARGQFGRWLKSSS